jgi:hypothetical protein
LRNRDKELQDASKEKSPNVSPSTSFSAQTSPSATNALNDNNLPPSNANLSQTATNALRPLPSAPLANNDAINTTESSSTSASIHNSSNSISNSISGSVVSEVSLPDFVDFPPAVNTSPIPAPFFYALCNECASMVFEELTHVISDLDREILQVEQSIKDWDGCSDFVIDDDAIIQVGY